MSTQVAPPKKSARSLSLFDATGDDPVDDGDEQIPPEKGESSSPPKAGTPGKAAEPPKPDISKAKAVEPPKPSIFDDEPQLPKEPKAKPTAEESFRVVTQQRDQARKDNQAFKEIFGETKPEAIKGLYEFVSSKVEGPVTPEAIGNIIETLKTSEETVKSLQERIAAQEEKIVELDIQHSDDFAKTYKQPYLDAAQSLFLEFANISGETIIGPESTKKFNEALLAKPEMNAMEVKSLLTAFHSEYKKETGEEPLVPSITSLMNSLRNFKAKKEAMGSAYGNWKVEKENSKNKIIAEQESNNQKAELANKRKRQDLASKAYREFEIEEGIPLEDKELQGFFRTEFDFYEGIVNKTKVPEYDEILKRGIHAQLWEKYKDKFKELLILEQEVEKGRRTTQLNGKPSQGKATPAGKVTGSVFDD